MSTNEEKIKEKIRKLLRLSQSSNENEAKAAMAKAQELLMQHKLSMADVSGEKSEVKELKTGIYYSRQKDLWRAYLIQAISKNYCVENFISTAYRSSRHEICLIGTEMDIQICLDVFKFASQHVEDWFKEYKKEEGWKYSAKYLNAIKNNYGKGFAGGVNDVLESQREVMQQEWGLVTTSPKEAQDFVNDLQQIKSKAKLNFCEDALVEYQGYIAGQKIKLNDKITGGKDES